MHPTDSRQLTVRAARLFRLLGLFLPAGLLLLSCVGAPPEAVRLLLSGALTLTLAGFGVLISPAARHDALMLPSILLHIVGLGWLLAAVSVPTPTVYLSRALLLVVPLGLFATHWLHQSGALILRRARRMADRLARRADLPADLAGARALPEVQDLRRALYLDAAPVLTHLGNPRPEVRLVMLAALEFRPLYQPGQTALLLHIAQQTFEPEVRAAAVLALGGVDDRAIIEPLAEFLSDSALVVRLAAIEAVLDDTVERWPWVRHICRAALACSAAAEDGPMLLPGQILSPDAVADCTGWAAEKGYVALRAAHTLAAHYNQVLQAGPDPALADGLRRQLADPHAPAALRLELARVLYHHQELDAPVLRQLIDPSSPAPLRLIGVEALLAAGESGEAVAALHDLARLPNRELALSTAEVVQRRLGIDLGLPQGQPLPAVHTRLAAEVARRLLAWSAQPLPNDQEDNPDHEESGWRSLSEL
jgi:hypothetical protein